MSDRYPGKVVIGLTGNIATGKSVVRRMLEHIGAFGIDADGLSHRAMSPGAPAYKPVVHTFGKWIVAPDGQINRKRLANIVFNDPEALAELETIVHPFVRQATDVLIRRSKQKLVAIEAIKLFESPLAEACDSIWVVDAPEQVRLQRLMEKRGMSEPEARMRIASQEPQAEKLARATVIINNGGSSTNTYEQIRTQLKAMFGVEESVTKEDEEEVVVVEQTGDVQVTVRRGGPRDVKAIATFLNAITGSSYDSNDVMMQFGEQAFILALANDQVIGLAGLQVENLIARVKEFLLAPKAPVEDTAQSLITTVEEMINQLQGEVALVFVPTNAPDTIRKLFMTAGYEKMQPDELKVPDWREAAREISSPNMTLYAKKMRSDRVLKPL